MAVLGTFDVIVLGGGACGCTTAYFLRKEGVSVALVEKGVVGREASWASAGMIGPESCSVRDPWFLEATTLSKSFYDQFGEELFELTGRRFGYGGKGHLLIARTDEAVSDLHVRADQVLPCLRNRPVLETWSGLRPCVVDGLASVGSGSASRRRVSVGHRTLLLGHDADAGHRGGADRPGDGSSPPNSH